MSRSDSPKRRKHSNLFEADRSVARADVCPFSGKIKYRSRKRALTALNALLANGRTVRHGDPPKRVYKCETCKSWHLTRSDSETYDRKRREHAQNPM